MVLAESTGGVLYTYVSQSEHQHLLAQTRQWCFAESTGGVLYTYVSQSEHQHLLAQTRQRCMQNKVSKHGA